MSISIFRLNYSLKFKAVLPCIMSQISTGLLPTSDCNKTLTGAHTSCSALISHSRDWKKIVWKICCSTQQILWVISPWKFSLVVGILGIFLFPAQNVYVFSSLPCMLRAILNSFPGFVHPNNVWWHLKHYEAPHYLFPSASCHFALLPPFSCRYPPRKVYCLHILHCSL